MFKRLTFITVLFIYTFLPISLKAEAIDASLFQPYHAAMVIYNRTSGEMVDINPELGQRKLAPCSTFKIYNTLIGLELGLLKGPDDPWYTWDGVVRDIEGWNKDLTLREAFAVSAVPAYQNLARQIGETRMKDYINLLNYGSRDTSSGIDVFWLPRPNTMPITISAQEQVSLLNQLLDLKLPFHQENIAILKDVMKVMSTEKGTLYGKTGSGMNADGKWNLGWFVGFLESGGTTYVFACNITKGKEPSGKVAREIVKNVFKSQGLL